MGNPSFIDDFPIKGSIYAIFSIAMFDYQRVNQDNTSRTSQRDVYMMGIGLGQLSPKL
jgi:hypothetical protein